jgi:hypothetical protein
MDLLEIFFEKVYTVAFMLLQRGHNVLAKS